MWGGDKARVIALAWEVISTAALLNPVSARSESAANVWEPRRSCLPLPVRPDQEGNDGVPFRPPQVRLVVEVLWPLFLFLILVWVRTTSQPFHKGQCK